MKSIANYATRLLGIDNLYLLKGIEVKDVT